MRIKLFKQNKATVKPTVISAVLAEQLPCFLLTESNMQHPQKRPAVFCLTFVVGPVCSFSGGEGGGSAALGFKGERPCLYSMFL